MIYRILKNKLKSFLGVKFYLLNGKNIEGLDEFNIDISSFYKKKKKGISGIYRIKDEENFIELSIKSCINLVDELIICYQESSDNTEKILIDLEKKYKNKINLIKYPFVYAARHEKFKNINKMSVHNLTYFYNFAFSKANYESIIKIDGDDIWIENEMKEIINKHLNDGKIYGFKSINLIKNGDGILGINKNFIYSGGHDHFIYKNSPHNFFINNKEMLCEEFLYLNKMEILGVGYYHLKGLKKDLGISYMSSEGKELILKRWENNKIIDLLKFLKENNIKYSLEQIKDIERK